MEKTYSDVELAQLADWAENKERTDINPEAKKAYGAIRQGADWLLRLRTKQRQKEIETAGDKAHESDDAIPARKH